MTKYQNWDIIEYIYYVSAKYISYRLSKIKKNKNTSVSLDYPKYCYIFLLSFGGISLNVFFTGNLSIVLKLSSGNLLKGLSK